MPSRHSLLEFFTFSLPVLQSSLLLCSWGPDTALLRYYCTAFCICKTRSGFMVTWYFGSFSVSKSKQGGGAESLVGVLLSECSAFESKTRVRFPVLWLLRHLKTRCLQGSGRVLWPCCYVGCRACFLFLGRKLRKIVDGFCLFGRSQVLGCRRVRNLSLILWSVY